jgi:flagellar basal body-associated protein FliL
MSGPAASAGSPYAYQPEKKKRNKWLWIGLPILLLAIIIAAVVGGVVGSRSGNNDNNNNTNTSGSNNNNAASSVPATNSAAGVGSSATGANGNVVLAVATDSYQLPVYPTGVSLFVFPALPKMY